MNIKDYSQAIGHIKHIKLEKHFILNISMEKGIK